MRQVHILLVAAGLMCLSGCVMRGTTVNGITTLDGLSERYPYDARALAAVAADELAARYPAGQTNVALIRVPGEFGDALDQALRQRGFALLQEPGSGGVQIGYVVDEITETMPQQGYARIQLSDAGAFSFVRSLGTLPPVAESAPTSLPEPLPVPTPLIETPPAVVSQAGSQLAYGLKPEDMQAKASAASPTALPSTPAVSTHPVRKTSTATAIAKRNKVAVEDFCRWNQVARTDLLDKGTAVYLENPGSKATFTPEKAPEPTPEPTPEKDRAVSSALADMAKTTQPVLPAVSTTTVPVVATIPTASTPAASPLTTMESGLPLTPPTPIVPEPEWKLAPGSLHNQLNAWAEREGWHIVWKAPDDLDMESSASFRGAFVDAMRQLFEGLHKYGHPLRVTLYQGNRVAEVSIN